VDRVVRGLILLLLGSQLGACTSFLAGRGDPDLAVLQRGVHRATIERQIGHPELIQRVEDGRYIALYMVKLGAPKNPDAYGESLTYIGAGAGAAIASDALDSALNNLASSSGRWTGKATNDLAGALIVGTTVWAIGEFTGTIRELSRLSKRRKHQLEVVYDARNKMLAHQLLPLAGGRLPANPALVLADDSVRRAR